MSLQEMVAIPAKALEAVTNPEHRWVAICRGTGCTSSASTEVQQALQEKQHLVEETLNKLPLFRKIPIDDLKLLEEVA